MSLYITQIGKHKFACGLFWQSLSRPRELQREAAELARKIDFDLMVLRTDQTTAQAGFAQSRDGAKRGVFSLAAAVCRTVANEGAYYDGRQQRVHNWLGAFKLPDGMWAYFAVRDANFLPNGDFAGTKEEVLERLHGDYGLGGWNVVIGDAELEEHGFHNFNAKNIEDLLPRKKNGQILVQKEWPLRPVAKAASWKPLAAGAAVLIVLGGAGAAYWQHKKKLEEEERARAFEAARKNLQRQAAPAVLRHPWLDKPAPETVAQACVDQFAHISAGGWLLEEYLCATDHVSYAWSRQNSTIEYLTAQVPGAVVDLSGEKATYSERLALGEGRDESLQEQKQLLEPLLTKLQLMGIAVRLAKVEPPPPPPQQPAVPGMAAPEPPRPDWKTFSFALSAGGVPPIDIATALAQPGVRIDKLIYRGGAWSIEGVMYAK
jgi:hypothetical protein